MGIGIGRLRLAAVCAVLVASIGLPALPSAGASESRGSISGTVTDSAGAPIANVCINAFPESPDFPSEPSPVGITDDLGHYELSAVPAGIYSVEFGCGGGDWVTEFYGDSVTEAFSPVVRVTTGQATTGIDAALIRGGTVAGTILDSTGRPAQTLAFLVRTQSTQAMQTDGQGHFGFRGVVPGTYRVIAGDSVIDPTSPRQHSEKFVVASGRQIDGISLELPGTGSLSGTVVRATDASAVKGACVNAARVEPTGRAVERDASTDETGHFSIPGVPVGSYRVRFSPCGDESLAPRFFGGTADDTTAALIAVSADREVSDVNASLEPAATIRGQVTRESDGSPVTNSCAQILAANDHVNGGGFARTDGAGRYSISGLPAGAYSVRLGLCSEDSELVPQTYSDHPVMDVGDPVTVAAGQSVADINEALPLGGSITGTMTTPDGSPAANLCLSAYQDGGGVWLSTTKADGTYRIGGLETGSYRLVSRDCASPFAHQSWYPNTSRRERAELIQVTRGQTTAGIDQVIGAGSGSISGTVTDSHGGPAGDACVTAMQDGEPAGPQVGPDRAGHYEIPALDPGQYTVRVANCRHPESQSAWYGGNDPASAVAVTVAANGDRAGTDVQFDEPRVPDVTGLGSTTGSEIGGDVVALVGDDLRGTTQVSFGGVPASSFVVLSPNEVDAVAPAGPRGATVAVTVTTPYGTSPATPDTAFAYTQARPTIASISPPGGVPSGGTLVTISGSWFEGVTGVAFGSHPATFTVLDDHTIRTVAPAGAGSVHVVVTTLAGPSSVSPADVFTYHPAPTVAALSSAAGPISGGTVVTIHGHGFDRASVVQFGGISASFRILSDSEISAVAPPSATRGTIDVTVTSPFGTSPAGPADWFRYIGSPWAGSISPDHGNVQGGTPVTIRGLDLDLATKVMFGTYSATSFRVNPDGSVTAIAPQHLVPNTVYVTVTTPYGTSDRTANVQFRFGLLH
jgi:protocatechuate 3,4-dioxygenase beta subunit